MQDRTSWSYRANLPGGSPDMYKEGGKAREAFREARCSPYIRENSQNRSGTQSQGSDGHTRKAFKAKRRTPNPVPSPSRGVGF